MPAGIKDLTSLIQGTCPLSIHYKMFFLKAQVTLSSDWVEVGSSGKHSPGNVEIYPPVLQVPNVASQF